MSSSIRYWSDDSSRASGATTERIALAGWASVPAAVPEQRQVDRQDHGGQDGHPPQHVPAVGQRGVGHGQQEQASRR